MQWRYFVIKQCGNTVFSGGLICYFGMAGIWLTQDWCCVWKKFGHFIFPQRAFPIANCVCNFFLWLHCKKERWIFGERIDWSMAKVKLINFNWASCVSSFVHPWDEASLVWIAVFLSTSFWTSLLVPFITQFYVSKMKSLWLVTSLKSKCCLQVSPNVALKSQGRGGTKVSRWI